VEPLLQPFAFTTVTEYVPAAVNVREYVFDVVTVELPATFHV
jgi:hypothetical protein